MEKVYTVLDIKYGQRYFRSYIHLVFLLFFLFFPSGVNLSRDFPFERNSFDFPFAIHGLKTNYKRTPKKRRPTNALASLVVVIWCGGSGTSAGAWHCYVCVCVLYVDAAIAHNGTRQVELNRRRA